jgi:hypothetical protein
MPSEANLRVVLDPATAASFKRDRQRLRDHFAKLGERCSFQRDTPPLNVVGGYKFPDAPIVDLCPSAPKPPAVAPESRPDLQIPDDLSIPPFLRRDLKTKVAS